MVHVIFSLECTENNITVYCVYQTLIDLAPADGSEYGSIARVVNLVVVVDHSRVELSLVLGFDENWLVLFHPVPDITSALTEQTNV